MTKEDLIYQWENQLVLLEVSISNAEERGSCVTATALDYQKNQLIACLADLKKLEAKSVESQLILVK